MFWISKKIYIHGYFIFARDLRIRKRNTFQAFLISLIHQPKTEFFQFLFRSATKTLKYGTYSIPSFSRQINKLKHETEQSIFKSMDILLLYYMIWFYKLKYWTETNQFLYLCIKKKSFGHLFPFLSITLETSCFRQTEFSVSFYKS